MFRNRKKFAVYSTHMMYLVLTAYMKHNSNLKDVKNIKFFVTNRNNCRLVKKLNRFG